MDGWMDTVVIMGIGLFGNGGYRVPRLAVGKLELQESLWCNSVWGQRPEKLNSNVQEQEKGGCLSSREFPHLPPFHSRWALHRLVKPAHIGEWGCSVLRLLIAMLISSGNALTVTPRNHVLPANHVALRAT